MKKTIICFLLMTLFSAIIAYGQVEQTDWIDQFVNSFELSDSNFKFYNIKSSVLIEEDLDIKELENITIHKFNSKVIKNLDGMAYTENDDVKDILEGKYDDVDESSLLYRGSLNEK